MNHQHFGYIQNCQKNKLNYRANPSFILFEGCTSSKVQWTYHFTCVTGTGPDLRKCPPGKCTKLEKKYGPKEDCTLYHSCLLMHCQGTWMIMARSFWVLKMHDRDRSKMTCTLYFGWSQRVWNPVSACRYLQDTVSSGMGGPIIIGFLIGLGDDI